MACWRSWEQAAEALDFAEEAEEFQAVGMRLRETLVQFARTVADDALVGDAERPKASDFQGWGRLLAASLATGDRGRRLRGYLLDLVSGTWQYVSWLTHVTDAVRADAVIALEAVAHLLNTFGQLMFPSDSDGKQCPDCGSRKLVNDYRRDSVPMEWMLCEACGWEMPFAEEAPAPQDVGMPEASAPPEGDCYTGTEGPGLLRRTSPTAK